MRLAASSLEEVYTILEGLPKPIAVFDFLCGEMGYEALCSQSVAHKFKKKCPVPVVALCWHGCSLLFSNVSEYQIEFANDEIAMLGNNIHRGEPRYEWLVNQGHRERVDSIQGIVAHDGPMYWAGGAIEAMRLRPTEYMDCLTPITTNFLGLFEYIRTSDGQSEFQSPVPRVTGGPYIAFFDRNETHQPERNVKDWHIKQMQRWARDYGYELVVISGLYPRQIDGAMCFTPKHRDLDLLCSVAQHATVFFGPPSGASEAAIIFGCDFATLGGSNISRSSTLAYQAILNKRGHRYLGELGAPGDGAVAEVERYLRR